MIAAAGRVGAEDGYQDREAHLLQLCVAVEGCAVSAPVGIDFLLLGQLDAGAVEDPHQRKVQTLGHVGDPQNIVGLPGDPRSGHHLIVGGHDHGPLAVDLAQSVDDTGCAFVVEFGIVDGVKGTPGALVDQIVQSLPRGHLAALLQLLGRNTGGHYARDLFVELGLYLLDVLHALRGALQCLGFERLADLVHLFEILSHWRASV